MARASIAARPAACCFAGTVLATGKKLLGFIMLASGIITEKVSHGRREVK